mmetsp:Transcript_71849/g.126581  ORF Transcript_71849/g.126581 Transcript_71849/m.126581 type:complete len:90 (+) Transcript_71849:2624-2893(+)
MACYFKTILSQKNEGWLSAFSSPRVLRLANTGGGGRKDGLLHGCLECGNVCTTETDTDADNRIVGNVVELCAFKVNDGITLAKRSTDMQ